MAPKADPKAKADSKPKKAPKKEKEEGEDEKSKVPAMPQPDREAFDASLAKIQEAIEKLQKKQASFAGKISERSGGKDEFYAKKAELRAQLDELSGKMNELQAKKEEIEKSVNSRREEGKEMRSSLNNMKKSIGFGSEQEIDNRIASIEFQLCTESVPLKQEKALLAEISQLKRNRPKVAQVQQMETKMSSFDPGMSMKEQKQVINEEMAQYRDAKKKVQEKMSELMDKRKEQLGDLPDIIEQRDAVGKDIAEKIKERNELRDAFRQEERTYNGYLAELRKARQEKAVEERAERQKEFELRKKQREVEKLDEQPFVSEITLIEQTLKFCSTMVKPKDEKKVDEKKEVVHDNPEGSEVLINKKDRDEEFYFAPTKGKKASKAKKSADTGKSIKHNAETFRLFDQLKLDAPLSTDDVPPLVEKLEAQLEDYQAKVKEWEAKREDMKKAILEGLAEVEEKKEEETVTEEKAE